jgi:hypothetical protein
VWFVGENRLVLFHDGERASLPPIPQPPELSRETNFEAVHGTSATNVFVVGSQGTILHWDGARWERETGNGLTAMSLRAVVALADGGAAVGATQGQVLLRVSGVASLSIRWTRESVPSSSEVREVFVGADERLLALTRGRELFARGPSGWQLVGRLDGALNETFAAVQCDGGVLVGGAGFAQSLWYLPAGADGLDGGWVGDSAQAQCGLEPRQRGGVARRLAALRRVFGERSGRRVGTSRRSRARAQRGWAVWRPTAGRFCGATDLTG